MKKKKSALLLMAVLLGVSCAGTSFAAGGDESDPLVTLSYLNQTAIPEIVAQVQTKAQARATDMEKNFDLKIQRYQAALKQLDLDGGGASYILVTLKSGQTMSLKDGGEAMLRAGSVTLSGGGSAALIDITAGTTAGNGDALVKNHLYMANGGERTLKTDDTETTLLVRGGYSIR